MQVIAAGFVYSHKMSKQFQPCKTYQSRSIKPFLHYFFTCEDIYDGWGFQNNAAMIISTHILTKSPLKFLVTLFSVMWNNQM